MNTIGAILKLQEVIRRQHKALATEASYVHWLRRYMGALQEMLATLTSEQKLERLLTRLAVERDVAASTQNQAFNAFLFSYKNVLGKPLQNVNALRATRPAHLRHSATVSETRALLLSVRGLGGCPTSLITRLLYGCGLRVSEPLNLRIKDVNLEAGVLIIRGVKGGKDRVVSTPPSLSVELGQQRAQARAVWLRDRQNRILVVLAYQLAHKYPDYQFAWPWAWMFPSHQPCRHPRTGRWSATGCTRAMCNVRSKKQGADSASWSCLTSCACLCDPLPGTGQQPACDSGGHGAQPLADDHGLFARRELERAQSTRIPSGLSSRSPGRGELVLPAGKSRPATPGR